MPTAAKRIDQTPVKTVAGLPWVANTSIIIGGYLYTRGCVVPDDVLAGCPNRDALIENRRVVQRSKVADGIEPRGLALGEPAKGRIVVYAEREPGDSFLTQWCMTVRLIMVANDCSLGLAFEYLFGEAEGRRLTNAAQKECVEINKHKPGHYPGRAIAVPPEEMMRMGEANNGG